MCKTWSIGYTCKHYYTTRLSTCHGTFTVQPKPGKPHKSACCSAPSFVVKSTDACGDCQRKIVEQNLQASVAAVRSAAGTSGLKLAEAEQAYLDDCFKLQKTFPGCRRYQGSAKPGKGDARVTVRNRGSLLKREVLAEEVVERYEEHRTVIGGTWDQSTWGDYTPLSDELAEKFEEETPSMDVAMTSCMGDSMDDYCKAFEQSDDLGNDQDEEHSEEDGDGASWSPAWSSEPEESKGWTSEEATYWSSEPEHKGEETTCWSSEPKQENDEDEALSATTHPLMSLDQEPVKVCRTDDAAAQKPATTSSPGKENETVQTFPTNHIDGAQTTPAATRPQAISTRTLPTRGRRPTAHRRSTFDGGKMEMELRDRLRCFRLAHIISVGGD